MVNKMSSNWNTAKKIRYNSLDTYKAIAALWIVCLHGKLPDAVSGEVCALARTAVPFFFMISGFFSYRPNDNDEIRHKMRKQKIIRYLKILLGVSLVYTGYYFLLVVTKRIDMAVFLSNFDLSFWLMNFSSSSGHLWFVRALIYMELIFLFFEPVFGEYRGTWIALALWISDVVFIKYSNFVLHITIPDPYFEILTKFFGTAMVYYILGYQCKIHEKEIVSCLDKFGKGVSILSGGGLIILNLAEYRILDDTSMNQMPSNYITTFLLSVCIFMWLIANRNVGSKTCLNKIGKKYSMYIYYWHLLVMFVTAALGRIIGMPEIVYLNPFIVYAETLIVSVFMVKSSAYLQRKYENKEAFIKKGLY